MNRQLLLAIEATSSLSGVALVRDGALLASMRIAHGMNLSGNLLHAAEWLLQRHGLTLEQMDAVAVDVGPGAFTALKIGVMIAKSWAHALSKPLVAVNAFEACAATMPADVPTLVALPARRDALYLQWLTPCLNALPASLCEPAFITRDTLAEWLAQNTPQTEPLQAVGDERARAWIASTLPQLNWRLIDSPSPEPVAQLGWRRLLAGETVHPFSLTPLYIQPPSIHIKARNPE
ncbi:MAG: tRNA (adenosine(37)-N6)-threonylcarbamoyltransferase complex dimerization subunit type 1 TsaB [Fimbriimonadales bacterium]|nr:tRNA (adenosine(37)-N6)-threonylcarbamoyltransferase complex dimerization subunit type 1 TsaB [Fimbriimonadales bacterium]